MKFRHSNIRRRRFKKKALIIICAFLLLSVAVCASFFILSLRKPVFVVTLDGTELGRTDEAARSLALQTLEKTYLEINGKFGTEYEYPSVTFEQAAFFRSTDRLPELSGEEIAQLATASDSRVITGIYVLLDGVPIGCTENTENAEGAFEQVSSVLSDALAQSCPELQGIESVSTLGLVETCCPKEKLLSESELAEIFGAGRETGIVSEILKRIESDRAADAAAKEFYLSQLDAYEAYVESGKTKKSDEVFILPYEVAQATAAGVENELSEPSLKMSAYLGEERYECLPNETQYIESAERYKGYSFVIKKGNCGVRVARYEAAYGGSETVRTELSSEVLLEPITEIIITGTKEPDPAGEVTGEMIWPIETEGMLVSSLFGDVREGYDENTGSHLGLDIQGYKGDPVWASDGGWVKFAAFNGSYGKLVIIDHGNGLLSYYAHLGDISVAEGDPISRGQVLGSVGMSGTSTNYHLHFEIRSGADSLDPLEFLPKIELHFW